MYQPGDDIGQPVQVEGGVHGEHRLRPERASHGVGVGVLLVGVKPTGYLVDGADIYRLANLVGGAVLLEHVIVSVEHR